MSLGLAQVESSNARDTCDSTTPSQSLVSESQGSEPESVNPRSTTATMAPDSDYSADSEDDTPIAKRKRSTGAKADNDDFSFKNVLRPPRSTTYTAQALYGTLQRDQPFETN